MKAHPKSSPFFQFESDFAADDIRCIPMIVRFKLDACGIKLKLAEWSRMTPDERAYLAEAACETVAEVRGYREALCDLIARRTGNTPTTLPVDDDPAWAMKGEIPVPVREKLSEMAVSLSVESWQRLTDLQRFALVKLSRPGHENRNFPKALREFGLTTSGY